jgi:hypothetical protein
MGALVLTLALGAPALWAQAPGDGKAGAAAGGDSPRGVWFGGRFSAERPKDPPPAPAPAARTASSPVDRLGELERLQNAYMRRTDVCDRLLTIARETSNPALEQEAQRLTDLAFQVYQQEAARLLGSGAVAGPSARDTLSGASPAGRRNEERTARVPEGK